MKRFDLQIDEVTFAAATHYFQYIDISTRRVKAKIIVVFAGERRRGCVQIVQLFGDVRRFKLGYAA